MSLPTRSYHPLALDNIEDIEEYRSGGYHPVHIGDIYQDRYKVLHKLGAGGFSTLWLARDKIDNRYVALKILKAEETASSSELRILQRLAGKLSHHPGRTHIRTLTAHFTIEGPNGVHNCLVTEVAGPSISELYNVLGIGCASGDRRLRADIARKVNRQLVEAVEFLHLNRVCHGDLTLPNVLLKLRSLDEWTEEEVYQRLGAPSKHKLLTTSKREPGLSAPRYVVEPAGIPSAEFLTENIFLVDFGEAFPMETPPKPENIAIPVMYQAPETIFDSKYNQKSEIWALACLLCEIRGGCPLFVSIMGGNNEIILQMVQIKGKIPEPWWSQWKKRAMWYDEQGRPLKDPPSGFEAVESSLKAVIEEIGVDDREASISAGPCPSLLEPYGTVVPKGEAEDMEDFLEGLLRWNPDERTPIDQIRRHRWIDG